MLSGQNCSNLNFQLESEIPTVCGEITMTMLHDRLGRTFLYVANKDAGLRVYNISDISNPVLVKHIPDTSLAGLNVINLSQQGNYLFLALGEIFNTSEQAGAAIVDISDPVNAFVTDTYILNGSVGGSGIIETEGNYAYLGAMANGIIVLDIADKANIQFVSQFVPDISFPDVNPDPAKINARGMQVRNDTIFLCYDAGGFRIIDATDKLQLNEIGRYSNPELNGLPRAYNNVALSGHLAYVAVDYCGVEVIDFSDPANTVLTGWWNPYGCPGNNWFSSPSHANEIRLSETCHQLYISTGKSDMMVLDISDPAQPDSCNFYGGVSNGTGTWGIDLYGNKMFLSYVCAFIPFSSFWTGVKALTFEPCSVGIHMEEQERYSVSFDTELKQILIGGTEENEGLEIYSILGQKLPFHTTKSANQILLQLDPGSSGLFILHIHGRNKAFRQLFRF